VHPVHPEPPHWAYFAAVQPPLPPPPPLEVVVAAAEDLVEVADVLRVVLVGTEVAPPPPEPGV